MSRALCIIGLIALLCSAARGQATNELGGAALPRRQLAESSATDELTTAEQVRQLTPAQAALHYPVRLRGIVTFCDANNYYFFVQDKSAGIYFRLDPSAQGAPLAAGQIVEILGEADPGEFAPVVMAREVQIIGSGTFPNASPVSFEQIASGQEDSQFVEIQGIVRAAQFDSDSGLFLVDITTGGGRVTAYAKNLPVAHGGDLVDSTISVRGVCVTEFNRQRQLFDIRLLVPRPSDLVIETAAPKNPFDAPTLPIEKLLQFTPQAPYGHRVKVSGTVIYRQDDDVLYIEDKTEGLYIETRQAGAVLPGDVVEVLGFPAKGEYTPMLQDAIFRKIASGPTPVPVSVESDEALKGTYDCRLVRIEATILDHARHSSEQFLVLQTSSGFIFHAYLESKTAGTDFSYLENGTQVAVTGVCLIETGNAWQAGEAWRAKSFRLLMRTAGDVHVLQWPPWWDLQKLLWALGFLGLVMIAAFAWVVILRRRVQKQTRIIRDKLQAEAALKERYQNLFENANDMVFTCDFEGRITSLNRAGEQLLNRGRDEIAGKKLFDFIAEEQRAAAERWFQQIVQRLDSPPAEWDFTGGPGQRLKLEIGARIVEKEGKAVEVEGIARDITERKRLEKEILEVSNREQQRIGHDLHDGVCQQLAGIAYRVDILADQLQERNFPEASEAERIGSLVNEAITQTRSVARGLFPVHLEESGLGLALEDLAANAGNLFKIKCDFVCDGPAPILENGVAAHLYYIAQEAVLNAVKHGKAGHITLSLKQARNQCELSIQDNGTGFQPANGHSKGMGVRIMHYRARTIGATLDLKSSPGAGTRIACVFYPAASERPQNNNWKSVIL
ncbi:MAG TPA: PAS domain-containing sensor histidine kinase [Candidatus Sulfotelmatobacter sp.]|nr:PAS domain-containing sensor histidine kinase [Candidatus Sulfotelmatobacter sp.]